MYIFIFRSPGGLVSPWTPGKSGKGILCTSPACNRAFPHFDLFRLDLLCTLLYPPFPLISLRLFYNYARPHTLETKMEVFKKPREWVLSPSSCAMACPVASVIGPEPRWPTLPWPPAVIAADNIRTAGTQTRTTFNTS